jgi:hypothetical protein
MPSSPASRWQKLAVAAPAQSGEGAAIEAIISMAKTGMVMTEH